MNRSNAPHVSNREAATGREPMALPDVPLPRIQAGPPFDMTNPNRIVPESGDAVLNRQQPQPRTTKR